MTQKTLFLSLLVWQLLSLAPRAAAAASPPASPGWLAYGDLRGHVEPCGCDPATDLGGIKRLGVVLDRERAVHPGLWLLGLGNDVPPPDEGELKTPFLLEADAKLQPVATLFNELEIRRAGEIRTLSKQKKTATPPYVLSNARQGTLAADLARPFVAASGVSVLGYVYQPSVGPDLERFGPALAKAWETTLKTAGGTKILLFSGPDADLQKIADAKLFDWIISSNNRPLTDVPGVEEKQDEGRLIRLKSESVYMVPLAGQGLLRGGSLMFDEAKPVSDLLKSGSPKTPAAPLAGDVPLFAPSKLVTWLSPASAAGDGPFKDLYDRYTQAARAAFLDASAGRLKDLKSSPFAGAEACVSCHPSQSKIYATTKHAHAMKTLQDKGKHEDAECVACHVVGAKAKGGFVSLAASPQFANVQCENCHGPRLLHTQNPAGTPKPPKPTRETCLACHNGQHSPKFDFETYWSRIKH